MSWVNIKAQVIALTILAAIISFGVLSGIGLSPNASVIKNVPITWLQVVGAINLYVAYTLWKRYI